MSRLVIIILGYYLKHKIIQSCELITFIHKTTTKPTNISLITDKMAIIIKKGLFFYQSADIIFTFQEDRYISLQTHHNILRKITNKTNPGGGK